MKAKDLMKPFDTLKIPYVSREENIKANIFSKLASTKPEETTRA